MDTNLIFVENGHKRKGKIVNCLFCNKEFPTRLNGGKKFCNKECNGKYKRTRIEVKCDRCNKLFDKKLSSSSKSGLYFCSRKCKDLAQRLDGLTALHLPHYGSGYSTYSCLIERTENPYCVDCEENRVYLLNVHHIDSDRNNNIISNLEIVCGNCHIKRHLKLVNGKWIYDSKVLTPRELLSLL